MSFRYKLIVFGLNNNLFSYYSEKKKIVFDVKKNWRTFDSNSSALRLKRRKRKN